MQTIFSKLRHWRYLLLLAFVTEPTTAMAIAMVAMAAASAATATMNKPKAPPKPKPPPPIAPPTKAPEAPPVQETETGKGEVQKKARRASARATSTGQKTLLTGTLGSPGAATNTARTVLGGA